MGRFEHNTDGADIYRNSFVTIREGSNFSRLDADGETVVVRIIHAAGQTDLAKDIVSSSGAARVARQALGDDAPIFTDINMIASGIIRKRLPADNEVICLLHDEHIPELAQELGATRTTAVVGLRKTCLEDAVVAIGSAPTALLHLLNCANRGSFPMPAAILAVPVGFADAAESKRATIGPDVENPELKYITVTGHRGGSAITCTALSAIATAEEIL